MNFHAPHDQAREREAIREAVLASFPADWRRAIVMVGGGDDRACFIELTPPITEAVAMSIGTAFKEAFPSAEIIMNGLLLSECPGASHTPWTPSSWPREFQPKG